MTPADFWNLAGRAGRWGKEFQGNIVCVDPENEDIWYNGQAPTHRSTFTIQSTTEYTLHHPQYIIDFIENGGKSRSVKERYIEHVLSYLCIQLYEYKHLRNSPSSKNLPLEYIDFLDSILKYDLNSIPFQHEIIKSNPGISYYAMYDLYNNFKLESDSLSPESLLPPDPRSSDSVQLFANIFYRLFSSMNALRLGTRRNARKRAYSIALMSVKWMRGLPIPQIINDRIDYEHRLGRSVNIPTVIRSILQDIESTVRFEIPKYLSVYNDILSDFYKNIKRQDLVEKLHDFSIYLEFGVSDQTQISLMSLGASRSTAIAATEYIVESNLTRDQVIDKLKEKDWKKTDIPNISLNEINDIISYF